MTMCWSVGPRQCVGQSDHDNALKLLAMLSVSRLVKLCFVVVPTVSWVCACFRDLLWAAAGSVWCGAVCLQQGMTAGGQFHREMKFSCGVCVCWGRGMHMCVCLKD